MLTGPELIKEYDRLTAENKTQVKVIKDLAAQITELKREITIKDNEINELNNSLQYIEEKKEIDINQDQEKKLNTTQEPDQAGTIEKLKEENLLLKSELNFFNEYQKIIDDLDRYLSGIYSISNHRFGARKQLIPSVKEIVKKYMNENDQAKKLYKKNCSLEKELKFYKTTTKKLSSYGSEDEN